MWLQKATIPRKLKKLKRMKSSKKKQSNLANFHFVWKCTIELQIVRAKRRKFVEQICHLDRTNLKSYFICLFDLKLMKLFMEKSSVGRCREKKSWKLLHLMFDICWITSSNIVPHKKLWMFNIAAVVCWFMMKSYTEMLTFLWPAQHHQIQKQTCISYLF